MPEIKNTFTQGKMNKDLDERIVPNGQYRDALNIQVSSSEGSDVGTVQNILGNTELGSTVGTGWECVGSIADEKNDVLYSFIHHDGAGRDAIMEYAKDGTETVVLADVNGDVLNFTGDIITGINIIDGLLFWTDGNSEPKKINIQRCKDGTSAFGTHTKLVVNTIVTSEDITEEHITVIKKRPTQAPKMEVQTIFGGALNSGSLDAFSISSYPTGTTNVTLTITLETYIAHASGTGLALDYTDVSGAVTTATIPPAVLANNVYDANEYNINVGDILLLSDPATQGILPNNTQIRFLVTDVSTATSKTLVAGSPDIFVQTIIGTILNIDSGTSLDSIEYDFVVEDLQGLLFDKSFPRFATRYKYEDGEYSAFSPFTQVGFDPGEFSIHPTKEPYNSGMETRVKSITLKEFVTHDIPLDVVEIDLLYKSDNSAIVYSIETIKPSAVGVTGAWELVDLDYTQSPPSQITDITLPSGGTAVTASNTGYYRITADNIHAAIPSNQLLRPWDNVPKTALAQEVTGNRLVYGNYKQNLDLGDDYNPYIVTRYEKRKFPGTDIDYSDGKQSVKSQRIYQGGIVYGDKYGRETPVFSGGTNNTVAIPYDQDATAVFKGMASRSNNLYITNSLGSLLTMDNTSTVSLDYEPYYFKVFIKETASEYYNLVMDRVYRAEEDGNLWISFPSSDRNKIQEDSYMVLKKGLGTLSSPATQVDIENKYKVIDIKNEAPDFIKRKYQEIGQLDGNGDLDTLYLDGMQPYAGANSFKISKDSLLSENLADIQKEYDNGSKYSITFKATISSDQEITSKRYRIISLTTTDSSPDFYTITLDKSIVTADGWVESSTGTLDTTLKTLLWKEEKQEWEEFQGRFFVKILSDLITDQYLESQIGTSIINTLVARTKLFYVSDVVATNGTGNTDINGTGLFQGLFGSGAQQTQDAPENTSGISDTKTEWNSKILHWDNGEYSSAWFIDAAYSPAQQPTILSDTGSWTHGDSSANIHDVSVSGTLRKAIKNKVNGMTGIIETDGQYCNTSAGSFMWLRQFDDGKTHSGSTPFGDWGEPEVYGETGSTGGEFYMHLSFSGVGEHLHPSSDFSVIWSLQDYISQPNHWDLQHIHNYNQQNTTGDFHHSTPTQISTVVPDMAIANGQWDPTYNHPENEEIIKNLVAGSKFQFSDDINKEVFTILKVTKKHLYNHIAWNRTYVWDGTENVIDQTSGPLGNSVWAKWYKWYNAKNQTNWEDLESTIKSFANPHNRRVCYILKLDKNPEDLVSDGTNTGVQAVIKALGDNDDLSASPTPVQTPTFMKFLKSYVSENSTVLSDDPAVWETEPKENTDLDIYYEASNAIPLKLDINNASSTTTAPDNRKGHMIGPIGSTVRCTKSVSHISTPNFGDCVVKSWDGNIVELDPGFDVDTTGGLSSSSTIDQTSVFNASELKFYKRDLSYIAVGIYEVVEITSGLITKLSLDRTLNKRIGLPYFNCFTFGNGVESNRIRDDFNRPFISNGVKASSTLQEQYKEEHRKNGLIYSGLYNSTGGINNLNQFIMAEKITKDLNPTYGSIQKLFSRRISLIAFCDDRVVGITANKTALYNADGNPQLVATNAVLGDANPFVGDYGISQNPESFAKESYRAYFTDRQRGAVLRLSMDGLTPISDAGMSDWFKDEFKRDEGHLNIIGSYDNYKTDYNLTFDRGGKTYGEQGNEGGLSQTVSFSEDVKGWTSFKSFIPESGVSMSGDYYTFYNGKCWKHHVEEDSNQNPISRNGFYIGEFDESGVAITNLGSSIRFLLNESPLTIKNYNTLNYDGDENWSCDSIFTDQQSGSVQSFIEKEGKWFNYIKGVDVFDSVGNLILDTKAFNFQGIGIATSIDI